jgi:hypothetical protein
MPFNAEVDSLAVFFFESASGSNSQANLVAKWVSYETYTTPEFAIPIIEKYWNQSVVHRGDGAPPYHVVNLSLLLPAGFQPTDSTPHAGKAAKPPEPPVARHPAPGDLTVIPQPRPGGTLRGPAFSVPYDKLLACPDITGPSASDLKYMVLDEGVVLANIPKLELVGMSCMVLGLVNLRPNGDAPSKIEHFKRLRRHP